VKSQVGIATDRVQRTAVDVAGAVELHKRFPGPAARPSRSCVRHFAAASLAIASYWQPRPRSCFYFFAKRSANLVAGFTAGPVRGMTVTVGEAGLLIDGTNVPVYSGAVHYWRLERERWPAILERVKSLGFAMIETYIPWSVHETSPGAFDWTRARDVDAFMSLCEEQGLRLLVRPGPLINAELTDFGFPEWVLLDPAVQARTALDTVHLDAAWASTHHARFPYRHMPVERFFELTAGWFDAVCPIIARHLAPAGCVVAVQSDNETCYLVHDQPYATDYSADSIALYHAYLRELHGSISDLNALYGTSYRRLTTSSRRATGLSSLVSRLHGISIGWRIRSTRSAGASPVLRGCCATRSRLGADLP